MAPKGEVWQKLWLKMAQSDLSHEPARAHDTAAPMEGDGPAEAAFWKRGARSSAPDSDPPDAPLPPLKWRNNLLLFLATVFSTFLTGALYRNANEHGEPIHGVADALRALPSGWTFAVPLMTILLCHEFGHFFAARYHRVPASLPYFIPLPVLSPFGTMGAVIGMRGRIKSRDAVLDIGASGPLAGLVIAIPVLLYGLAHSSVEAPVIAYGEGKHWVQEGQSLLYMLLKRVAIGRIPADFDVTLSPMAFAGWSGLFVTALNLLPVGQLDGGHVAYALLGQRHDRVARVVHWSLLLVFAYNLVRFLGPVVVTRRWSDASQAFGNSMFWLWWFGILHLLGRIGGRNHPPTDPGELSPGRRVVAVVTLVLFVLLFMPTPWAEY